MSVTQEERDLANKVIAETKRTVHVDTGRLKRSLDVRVQKGKLTFRQYFYGVYNDNSELVQNAKRIMGSVPYTIELLDEEGNKMTAIDYRGTGRGRTTKAPAKKKESSAKALINKILAQKKKDDGKTDTNKDN